MKKKNKKLRVRRAQLLPWGTRRNDDGLPLAGSVSRELDFQAASVLLRPSTLETLPVGQATGMPQHLDQDFWTQPTQEDRVSVEAAREVVGIRSEIQGITLSRSSTGRVLEGPDPTVSIHVKAGKSLAMGAQAV